MRLEKVLLSSYNCGRLAVRFSSGRNFNRNTMLEARLAFSSVSVGFSKRLNVEHR